jgi:hypothetical protein
MTRTFNFIATGLVTSVLLAGCATTPMGPTARVMPAPGKPFEVFAGDQTTCKQYASGEVGDGSLTSNLKQLGTAALTTGLGAGLGAAVHGARGAEIGGAVGGIAGGAMAAHGSAQDQHSLQGRYDLAYTQCMYSHGNQVAGVTPAGATQRQTVATGPTAALGAAPGIFPTNASVQR